MKNPLLQGLERRLSQEGDPCAIIDGFSNTRISAKELKESSLKVANCLEDIGVCRDKKVVVTTKINEEFCQIIFACMYLGAIPTFIDPKIPEDHLRHCLNELDTEIWISDTVFSRQKVYLVENIIGQSKSQKQISEKKQINSSSDDTCMILYTTGTTGIPKGVPWTSEQIKSHMVVQEFNYKKHCIKNELVLFPHLAIISIAMGRSVTLPRTDTYAPAQIDIAELIEQIDSFRSEYIFASPKLWKRVGDYCKSHNIKLSPIKVISTAGSSINAKTLVTLSEFAPRTEVHIPYASTEVLMPITSISLKELVDLTRKMTSLGLGIPLGKPCKDIRVSIAPLDEINNGIGLTINGCEVGEIIVSGPRVTAEYVNREESTRLSKIHKNNVMWHRMGDIGYIDELGTLWFLCRKKHLRFLGEKAFFPDAIEQYFNYHLNIASTAIVCPDSSAVPSLIFPAETRGKISSSKLETLSLAIQIPTPKPLYFPGDLPTDTRHNSKIDRDFLENWSKSYY